jgi:hypothetical protein
MSLENMDQVLSNIARLSEAKLRLMEGNARVKLTRAWEYTLKSADGSTKKVKKQYANNPLYTGTSGALRDSGTATDATVRGEEIVAQVGFNTDYAAAVHERTAVLHGARLQAKHPGIRVPNLRGQAKFLSVPMRRWRRKFADHIAKAVKRG